MNKSRYNFYHHFIVWQRFCEPARLRIAYCLWFRVWVVRHLKLKRAYVNSCKPVYDLEVCSSLAPWHYFFWHAPYNWGGGASQIPLVSLVMYYCCCWSSVPAADAQQRSASFCGKMKLLGLVLPNNKSSVLRNQSTGYCLLLAYPFARQAVRWGPFILFWPQVMVFNFKQKKQLADFYLCKQWQSHILILCDVVNVNCVLW